MSSEKIYSIQLKQTWMTRAATNNYDVIGYELDTSKIQIGFGAHKGMSLDNLEQKHPEYVEWLIQKSAPYSWIRNDRLMEALEYTYMRIFHRTNKTSLWLDYCKQLDEYNETLDKIQKRKKEREQGLTSARQPIKDDRPFIIERLLHRKREIKC